MQFGVCAGIGMADDLAKMGYEFIESSVSDLLKPDLDDDAFAAHRAESGAAGLPCPVVNMFVPGGMKITGPDADPEALEAYVWRVCRRAGEVKLDTIVFGSGGARGIPDGFNRDAAWGQLVDFCRMTGPVARDNGITIAVEPLHQGDCNVLTTVSEAARLVGEVNDPAIRLLVDAYHWAMDGDSAEDIVAHADLLAHTHVATVPNRRPPGAEACDLSGFFDALRRGGYDGRVSFEGRIQDAAAELPAALALMRTLTAAG